MVTPAQREVYRQRYETYRFHYRLEWQLFQAGAAIGLITLGLGKEAYKPQPWQFIISGIVFMVFSYAMFRLAIGIKQDRPNFIHYARLVGDDYISEIGFWYSSAAVWGRLILHYLGVILVVWGICKADAVLWWLQVLTIDAMVIELAGWTAWQTLSKELRSAREVLLIICVTLLPIAIIMGLAWYYAGI